MGSAGSDISGGGGGGKWAPGRWRRRKCQSEKLKAKTVHAKRLTRPRDRRPPSPYVALHLHQHRSPRRIRQTAAVPFFLATSALHCTAGLPNDHNIVYVERALLPVTGVHGRRSPSTLPPTIKHQIISSSGLCSGRRTAARALATVRAECPCTGHCGRVRA